LWKTLPLRILESQKLLKCLTTVYTDKIIFNWTSTPAFKNFIIVNECILTIYVSASATFGITMTNTVLRGCWYYKIT